MDLFTGRASADIFCDTLSEKLALKGDYKGTIFQRLVAATYILGPVFDRSAAPAFEELAQKLMRQAKFLGSKFDMEKVHDDPYRSMKQMTQKINQQKDAGKKPNVRVFDEPAGPDGKPAEQGHPVFTQDVNTTARWVHDIIAHYYGQHPFSARGEYGAYNRHIKTLGAGTLACSAMFTEVVAQTSCYYVYGNYVAQKVFIMDDFDHVNVGALDPSSPLNNFFELRNKELLPKAGFNVEEFARAFPELFKELQRQEQLGKNLAPLHPLAPQAVS